MKEIKAIAQGLNPEVQALNMEEFVEHTGNVYETLSVISKRANQITVDLKVELHAKLEEFASSTDSLEEIHENKEQIEISRFYEKLPNPALIAMNQYNEKTIAHRYRDEEEA